MFAPNVTYVKMKKAKYGENNVYFLPASTLESMNIITTCLTEIIKMNANMKVFEI